MCQPATGFANQCAVPLQDWIGGKDSKKITKDKKVLDIQCNNENRLRHLTQAICSKFLSVKQMSIAENRITAGTLR